MEKKRPSTAPTPRRTSLEVPEPTPEEPPPAPTTKQLPPFTEQNLEEIAEESELVQEPLVQKKHAYQYRSNASPDEEIISIKEPGQIVPSPSSAASQRRRSRIDDPKTPSTVKNVTLQRNGSCNANEHCVVEIDPIRQFFLSLADTVKTLPPLAQARLKMEVFNCVNTAELKYLQARRETDILDTLNPQCPFTQKLPDFGKEEEVQGPMCLCAGKQAERIAFVNGVAGSGCACGRKQLQ